MAIEDLASVTYLRPQASQPRLVVRDESDGRDTYVTDGVTDKTPGFESTVTGVTLFSNMEEKKKLLDQIGALVRRYISMSEQSVTSVTLWVIHTWMLDYAEVTPYIHIYAPQKQSGKTKLMEVLAGLAARPKATGYISAAGMRRIFDTQPPYTLFFDEVDQIFKKSTESTADLQAVLNLGFKRNAVATIGNQKGKEWEFKDYKVFSPKVLVSIGVLPDTIESRCIPIILERMGHEESKPRLRERIFEAECAPIRAMLSMLGNEELPTDPEIPEELSGRQADIWEPLLQIADWVGGEWPQMARDAAVWLHAQYEDEDPKAALLRHIKEVFDKSEASGMYSQDLVDELVENEEWPYQQMVDNRPLTTHRLANMLHDFKIKPVAIRLYHVDSRQQRGYYRLMFEDAWSRYL